MLHRFHLPYIIIWLSPNVLQRKDKRFCIAYSASTLDCPLLKGNQAATPKIERPDGKNTNSKKFLKSVKDWCGQLTWKINEAISSKIWIESKQIKANENQWRSIQIFEELSFQVSWTHQFWTDFKKILDFVFFPLGLSNFGWFAWFPFDKGQSNGQSIL